MKCNACKEFYEKYPLQKDADGEYRHFISDGIKSAPIKCAFENGIFDFDNWCCQSLVCMREVSQAPENNETIVFHMQDDNCAGSISVLYLPPETSESGEFSVGYLIMTYYKDRGCTSDAFIVSDGERSVITIEEINRMYEHFKQYIKE